MAYRHSCAHIATVTDIPLATIAATLENAICADCEYKGPSLWICLHKECLKVGCADDCNDHSTLHNRTFPTHCIQMNVTNKRLWCYECERETFIDQPPPPPPPPGYLETDDDNFATISHDSGHGSYGTMRTETTPEKTTVFPFERNPVGLNVGMSGDTSESSEGEDNRELHIEKPQGLVGLQNIGNTCYMNAALQALSNTIPLTRFFLDCTAIVQITAGDRKPCLSRTYMNLVKDIWIKKHGGYVTPSGILYGIRHFHAMFRGYHQHDTQEFLRNFMDQLHEELKQVAPPDSMTMGDSDTFAMAVDEAALGGSYDSSEGEYETCDSGVSERSSLSDDTEAPASNAKRKLSRSPSPGRKHRTRMQSAAVIDSQPSTNLTNPTSSKKPMKYRSIISDIFDGKLLSSVQCLTCNRISSRVETFQDLSLPIPSRDHLVVLHGRNTAPTSTCSEAVLPVQDGWVSWILAWLKSWFYGPTVTLHDCLAAFFSTDELKGDNMYSCEKCNKLRNGIKFSKVLQLPEVLCIHLKRFRHELMFSSKISSAVSFPLRGLDMRPYLHKDCISNVTTYELFSVICHHGTAGGGHYTCYALNSGQWYEFDDQFVTEVSAETVQACEAYVLFYRKVVHGLDEVKSKALELSEMCEETSDDFVYISKQWMCRFYTFAEPGPIDNSDFLCHHGSVHPDRAPGLEQLTIMLPLLVYEYLYKTFGGCPAITTLHICPACQALHNRIAMETEMLRQKVENQESPNTHLLSTAWYAQWHSFIKQRTLDPPGPIDNSKLIPSQMQNAEYTEVSEDVWNFFHSIYGGGPEITIRQKQIPRCSSDPSMQTPETPPEAPKSPDVMDKSIYSHGEPMDVSENVAKEVETVDEPMQVCKNACLSEVGEAASPANGVDGAGLSSSDEMTPEESSRMEKAYKTRRRRKEIANLYL